MTDFRNGSRTEISSILTFIFSNFAEAFIQNHIQIVFTVSATDNKGQEVYSSISVVYQGLELNKAVFYQAQCNNEKITTTKHYPIQTATHLTLV